MEMNTRIQVEHPVTEAVMGVDVMKEQIRIAAGENCPSSKPILEPRGHAIECRINAEDPEHGFRPSPGVITNLHIPGGPGIRVDSHMYQGYRVPPYYDSLLGKIIAHGPNREVAIRRMMGALDELVVEGIHTTAPFLRRILESETFRRGQFSTSFVERFMNEKSPGNSEKGKPA
jgi:acetyl-CoA carboxylase biotin carboxylase subunit